MNKFLAGAIVATPAIESGGYETYKKFIKKVENTASKQTTVETVKPLAKGANQNPKPEKETTPPTPLPPKPKQNAIAEKQ